MCEEKIELALQLREWKQLALLEAPSRDPVTGMLLAVLIIAGLQVYPRL